MQGRECLFGDVVDDEMRMNDAGRMVESVWNELPGRYPGVTVEAYVVMPNHFHGIVVLVNEPVGAGPRACPDFWAEGHPQGGAPTLSLFDVVHRFKSLTTARYRHGVKQADWPPFPDRLWQRNYYERVIRNEQEWQQAGQYIIDNPQKLDLDRKNPSNCQL